MKKYKNTIKILASLSIVFALLNVKNIEAVSLGMSASSSTVYVGNTFTVTISAPNAAGRIDLSCSGGSLSKNSEFLDKSSFTVTVTPNGVGTVTVYANGVLSDYSNPEDVNVSKSVSVNVINRPTNEGNYTPPTNGGSTNVNTPNNETAEETADLELSALLISEGKLSPAFASSTYEYTATVGNDVEKVKIEATAKDSAATVEGAGEKTLKEGDNTFEIKVSKANVAETMVYEINIHREGKPAVTLDGVSKDKLGVLNSIESAPILKNFEEYVLKIDGVEVKARRNSLNGIVVVYAIDENNEKNYYIYDEKKQKITSIYIPVALLGNEYAIVTVPKKLKTMDGYKFGKVTIDNQEFEGWSFKDKDFENYKLVYLMNDKGETNLYQYEKTMNTLQLYSNAAPISQSDYESLLKKSDDSTLFMYVFMGMSVALSIVVIGTLMFTVRLKKRR